MEENEYIVNGIRFSSESEYKEAKKEFEGINYIMQKNDMSDEQVVLALYNKFVQKQIFHTQIGHRFLKELQERLLRSDTIDKSEVLKLPIYDLDEESESVKHETPKKEQQKKLSERNMAFYEKKETGAPLTTDKEKNSKKENRTGRIKLGTITKKSKEEELRGKYRFSLFINIVLILLIIAMAYITLKSDHVNILNYESKVLDKYASWAQELQQKEERLNKLEKELEKELSGK